MFELLTAAHHASFPNAGPCSNPTAVKITACCSELSNKHFPGLVGVFFSYFPPRSGFGRFDRVSRCAPGRGLPNQSADG
jgi:hypothetical protein